MSQVQARSVKRWLSHENGKRVKLSIDKTGNYQAQFEVDVGWMSVERCLDCCPPNLEMWLQMRLQMWLESVALGVRIGSVAVRESFVSKASGPVFYSLLRMKGAEYAEYAGYVAHLSRLSINSGRDNNAGAWKLDPFHAVTGQKILRNYQSFTSKTSRRVASAGTGLEIWMGLKGIVEMSCKMPYCLQTPLFDSLCISMCSQCSSLENNPPFPTPKQKTLEP
jgi:hypothetical protein